MYTVLFSDYWLIDLAWKWSRLSVSFLFLIAPQGLIWRQRQAVGSTEPLLLCFFASYFSVVAETPGHERKLSLSLYLPSASPPLPPLQLMSLKQMNFWVPPALRKPPTETFPPFPPALGFITRVQLISHTIQSAVACRYIMTAADDDFRYWFYLLQEKGRAFS